MQRSHDYLTADWHHTIALLTGHSTFKILANAFSLLCMSSVDTVQSPPMPKGRGHTEAPYRSIYCTIFSLLLTRVLTYIKVIWSLFLSGFCW